MDSLAGMLKEGKVSTPEYSELKRRFGFEFNGMRLHEYYFTNLGGNGILDKAGSVSVVAVRLRRKSRNSRIIKER